MNTAVRGTALWVWLIFAVAAGISCGARGDELPTPAHAPPQENIFGPWALSESLQGESFAENGPATSEEQLAASDAAAVTAPPEKADIIAEAGKATSGGNPPAKFSGQLQIDALWFSQSEASRIAVGDAPDAFNFRRARIGVVGDTGDVFNYALRMDFALGQANNGRPQFLDVFVGIRDLPVVNNLRVGHFFEPFSLERMTVVRYNTFLERSLADTFAPARNLGIAIFSATENQRATWALGTFRSNSDAFGDDAGDQRGQAITGRATWLPIYDEALGGQRYVHLGGAYSYRHAADGIVRYRTRPEALGRSESEGLSTPFFADTGNLAANDNDLYGLEAAWVNGPLSVQGEWMFVPVDRAAGPDAAFSGGYVYLSYFLTGEHRPYNRQLGYMDRVMPHENFFHVRTEDGSVVTGRGAWEATFRVSHIDLSDEDVRGGELTNLTAGLNWYLTAYVRMKVNAIRSYGNGPPNGDSNASILGIRWDVDF